jgi:predicted nucleic acid-binding protein
MDRKRVLIDTSIIIDHLRKGDKKKSLLYKTIEKNKLYISSVSVFELYAGAIDERKTKDIEIILRALEPIPFSAEMGRRAGKLYISLKKENLLLEIRDLLIGATAITWSLPLLTLNKKHFNRMQEITLYNL